MAIRMGVIGGGIFGETHLQIFTQMQQEGRCVLAGLADLNEKVLAERARQYGMKTYTDYRQMLARENLDGVAVVTPDPTHLPIVLDALEAGCHVLVEKPMDVTVEGCEKMVAAARRKGLLLQVDFHKRFDPYHTALRDAVAAGQLGTPLYGYAWMENRTEVPRDWWPAWVSRSSPAWFLGSHMVDLFRWLIGGRNATRVYATGVKKKLAAMGVDTYDCIQAKVDFEDDIAFNLDTAWVLPDGFEAPVNQGIRLVGTDGIMEIDSQNRGAEACLSGRTQETLNMGYKLIRRDKHGRPRYEGYGFASIADVVENIAFLKEGGRLEDLKGTYPSGEDGLEVTRILCAIHESIRTHRLVELA
ncbi:MAG TPA: Gfo/Idh/MocA family oxidoreductase [Phycisphaerae bacterium]|nr:Gfo/Idh/MocA family oxidoreductase [Phycisphaerae bacterium]